MAQKINDAWQQAVRGMDIAQMEALLSEDPGLASQGIVHTRGNGTTYRKSPLRMVNRSIDAAQLLLNAGADPNDGADSVLAIHNASPEVAELLLNAGAEIDRIGYEQGTALMFEVGQRNPDTAKLLIDRGVDLNIQRTMDGNTALHFAVIKQYPKMVDLLLAGGADPKLKNNDEHTPLDIAQANNAEEIIRKLKETAGQ